MSNDPMRRLALVIGIEKYFSYHNSLENAIKNADNVANSLKRIGFIVGVPK